jgi:conjugative transfer region protein TrbK
MDPKLLVRLGAAVFVALAIVASAVEMTRKPDDPIPEQPSSSAASDASLRDELLRCQLMGNLPTPPKECLDAWAESRRRFLGGDPSASLPVRTTPPITTPDNTAPPAPASAGQAASSASGQGH